ncbi:hypothetical protein WJU23_20050 [Prosthecobacter sp. SYSU 5D2]|uniref:hypothetical protein n=1 Tax=Prosthecobacter sp. SYSU 5D2 TaxID=3134134 RepID=UPI0031FEAA23
MKNLLIPVLGAVSIISIGAVAWLLATPASVDPRSVKLESELQEARQTIAKLRAELARKPAAQPASTQLGSAATDSPAPATAATDSQGNLQEMLRTPAMRAVIDEQQAAQIEVGYAQLFEHLGLNPEERQNFKQLLTARQKALTDLSLQLMNPNLTPEQRQELIAEAKNQQSVYNASIQKFLNEPRDYQTFQQWEAVQPERTQYDTIGRSLFGASGEPLSPEQEQRLFTLMAQVRTSPSSVGGLNDQTGTDPNLLTDEVIAQQLRQIQDNHRIVAERAQEFLTAGQRQTLNSYLQQLEAMSRSSINVSKMILRGASGN